MLYNLTFFEAGAHERYMQTQKNHDFYPCLFQFGPMFRITTVDARTKPLLFFLEDLLGKKLRNGYYQEVTFTFPKRMKVKFSSHQELKKCPPPEKGVTFIPQRIVDEKTINGKTYYYIKYKHYDDRYKNYTSIEYIKRTFVLDSVHG